MKHGVSVIQELTQQQFRSSFFMAEFSMVDKGTTTMPSAGWSVQYVTAGRAETANSARLTN
jgi:hypothetical protein